MANTYRKALQDIFNILSSHTFQTIGAEDAFVIGKCHRAAEGALKTPPRNCDIGTALQQVERHHEWCELPDDNPYSLKCIGDCRKCFSRWAQRAFEEVPPCQR